MICVNVYFLLPPMTELSQRLRTELHDPRLNKGLGSGTRTLAHPGLHVIPPERVQGARPGAAGPPTTRRQQHQDQLPESQRRWHQWGGGEGDVISVFVLILLLSRGFNKACVCSSIHSNLVDSMTLYSPVWSDCYWVPDDSCPLGAGGLCPGAFGLQPAGPPAVSGSYELRLGCDPTVPQQSRLQQVQKTVSMRTPVWTAAVRAIHVTLILVYKRNCFTAVYLGFFLKDAFNV